MTPEQFCNWLRGFSDINSLTEPPTKLQWERIKSGLDQINFNTYPPYPDKCWKNPPQPLTPTVYKQQS